MTMEMPATREFRARVVRVLLVSAVLLGAALGSGCSHVQADKLPYAKLALPYQRTELGRTSSLEVLSFARDPAYQFDPREAEPVLLTQGDSLIAYSGRSTDSRKTWLDLIVFNDLRMTAGRKYFFAVDERSTADPRRPDRRRLLPGKSLLFDSEFGIDPEVLTTPYATEEAQKIAILKWLAERFQSDVTALVGSPKAPAQGNEQIVVSSLMANQVFQGLLTELTQSPGLAQNLATEQGVPFPHASLGTGRLRLLVHHDTALLTVRINLPLPALARP
jgi:hypothetical protein